MAITKMTNMKAPKNGLSSIHLRNAINYILNPVKTNNGELVGSLNCNANTAYQHMMDTKRLWNKTDKRQGYHFVISFPPGEVDEELASTIIKQFAKEYLGERFEVVYAVHNDREHMHGHIIFNSVSYLDGYKYHYANGEWARDIQPITNRLCEKYNLSTINVEEPGEYKNMKYDKYAEQKSGIYQTNSVSVREQIATDIDAVIDRVNTFDEFVNEMENAGYQIKMGKHIAFCPVGSKKYFRGINLKKESILYTEDGIRERIENAEIIPEPEKMATRAHCDKYDRKRLVELTRFEFVQPVLMQNLLKHKIRGNKSVRMEQYKLEKKKLQVEYLQRHNVSSLSEIDERLQVLNAAVFSIRKDISAIYKERNKHEDAIELLSEMEGVHGEHLNNNDQAELKDAKEYLQENGYEMDELETFDRDSILKIKELYQRKNQIERERRLCKDIIYDSAKAYMQERERKEEFDEKKQKDKNRS